MISKYRDVKDFLSQLDQRNDQLESKLDKMEMELAHNVYTLKCYESLNERLKF